MHFINQINFVATTARCIGDVIKQFTRIINTGARCGIDFNQIEKSTFINLTTGGTLATRCRANTLLAVEAFGKNSRDGGFTNTPGAGKKISMVQAILIERIGQSSQHVLLTEHVFKTSRPPAARQCFIAHLEETTLLEATTLVATAMAAKHCAQQNRVRKVVGFFNRYDKVARQS